MVNENLLATYALLSFIRESYVGQESKSLLDVFVPLIKEAISQKLEDNQGKEYKGHDYTEIKDLVKRIFSMDIPIPVLSAILPIVQSETEGGFQLFGDHSFIINNKCKSKISRDYNQKKKEIKELEENYSAFCESRGVEFDFQELVDFIQDQRNRIFDNATSIIDSQEYYVSTYVHDVIKKKNRYFDIMSSIYIGGLIGSYFKFHVDSIIFDAELLIDTNFYISLIDLNTEEAFDTCNQLFKMAESMGFRFFILETTIEQIKILLSNRSNSIGSKDFISAVDDADILAACQRRGLNGSDLDSYKFNLGTDLKQRGVSTVYKSQIRELVQKAEKSKDLKKLTGLRGSYESALNDILANEYVLYRRKGKAIADFSDVNCWFLNNSFTSSRHELDLPIWQRVSITASDLLTLLWLANPSQNQLISKKILAATCLSANVIKYRSEKLPDHQLIEKIQDKVAKLQSQGIISQETIAKICVRMSEGCIDDNEAERLLTLSSSDFLSFFDKMYENEDLYLEEHTRNNKLAAENKMLSAENKVSKAQLRGVLYVIGIVVLYVLYRVFIIGVTSLRTWQLNWIIDAIYWIITTIGINLFDHKLFLDGIVSLFSPKYRHKLISRFLGEETATKE